MTTKITHLKKTIKYLFSIALTSKGQNSPKNTASIFQKACPHFSLWTPQKSNGIWFFGWKTNDKLG